MMITEVELVNRNLPLTEFFKRGKPARCIFIETWLCHVDYAIGKLGVTSRVTSPD